MQPQRFSSWPMIILSAFVSACTLPTVLFGYHLPNLSFLAWLSLVPLFLALRFASVKRAWLISFVWSVIYYSLSLYWIYHAVHVYGGFGPPLSIAVTALLALVLSLYLPCAAAFAVWLTRRTGVSASWWLIPAWVLAEVLHTCTPAGGFAWAHLALSQWQALPLLQGVEFFGVSGLIAFILMINVLLSESILLWHAQKVRQAFSCLGILFLIYVSYWGFGVFRIKQIESLEQEAAHITVGLVQANIAQDEKWTKAAELRNLRRHQKLSAQLAEHNTDLIVWPETSFPGRFPPVAPKLNPEFLGLKNGQSSAVLFGGISVDEDVMHNSAFLYNAQGDALSTYHKIHLVPFGEYVPWQNIFTFAKKLTQPVGTFLPGEKTEPLLLGNIRIAPLICFEDIFVNPARQQVLQGADLLANLTNDAWYGNTSASYQHLGLSVFRSVENRRSLVRAANTGVSAFVAPSGRIVTATPLFTEAVLSQAVPLLELKTFHQAHPNFVAFACLLILLVALGYSLFAGRKE